MTNIKCGHCKAHHASIGEVKACAGLSVKVVEVSASVAALVTPATEGMYLKDGRIFKVQRAVHGSGHLYAKELVDGSFVYAGGMFRQLDSSHAMTLEQAKEYGALYGVCCACARTLTDEASIEAGIGPVCAKRFV